jgi:hypothetical protein
MLPLPLVSIESKRFDIFTCGGMPVLAPDMAFMAPDAATPEISIDMDRSERIG